MTLLVVSCCWVILATGVAFLPFRHQFVPGLLLLLAAPVLIFLITRDFGFIPGAMAALGFVSMFRKPLRYFARKAFAQAEGSEK